MLAQTGVPGILWRPEKELKDGKAQDLFRPGVRLSIAHRCVARLYALFAIGPKGDG